MSEPRYIATQDIYAAPGVAAFRKGQEVPASAVANLSCQAQVTSERGKLSTKDTSEPGKVSAKDTAKNT